MNERLGSGFDGEYLTARRELLWINAGSVRMASLLLAQTLTSMILAILGR